MLKKMLLMAACVISTIAVANLSLDLNLTITSEENEIRRTGNVVVKEDEVNSIQFDELDELIVNIASQRVDEKIIIHTQFLEKSETGEIALITQEWLSIEVSNNERGTISVNDSENNVSLVLEVTPSIIEESAE